MIKLLFATLSVFLVSLDSYANEISYFYCTSQTKFAAVEVTQVITQEDGAIHSTFKLKVWDLHSQVTEYWQKGIAQMGSDNSFTGTFEAEEGIRITATIKAPTFPDYKPRESLITQGSKVYALNCVTL